MPPASAKSPEDDGLPKELTPWITSTVTPLKSLPPLNTPTYFYNGPESNEKIVPSGAALTSMKDYHPETNFIAVGEAKCPTGKLDNMETYKAIAARLGLYLNNLIKGEVQHQYIAPDANQIKQECHTPAPPHLKGKSH